MAFREKSINITLAKPGSQHLNQLALKSVQSSRNKESLLKGFNSRLWLCKESRSSSQNASCPEVLINYYFTKRKGVMYFCHFGQDLLQAAKNTSIPKYQNYVGRLQNVLTRDKTEFSHHKSTRN